MTELPRPSTTDKYSGIGSSLSGMISFTIIKFIQNLFLFRSGYRFCKEFFDNQIHCLI